MGKKKLKYYPPSSENDRLSYFFKAHHISKKEKAKTGARNYAFRLLKDEGRVQRLATAFFQHLPAEKLAHFEEKNSQTTKRLFHSAEQLLEGAFGTALQNKAQNLDEALFAKSSLQKLLLIDCALNALSEAHLPEIIKPTALTPTFQKLVRSFDLSQAKNLDVYVYELVWTYEDKLAVEQLLRRYLSNLVNPSHVSVDLMIEHDEPIEKSLKIFEKMTNPSEQSKSLTSIVKELIHTNRFKEAMETAKSFRANKGSTKPFVKVIDQLLNPSRSQIEKLIFANRIDETLDYAKTIENVNERNKLYQKIAQALIKHHRSDLARQVVKYIHDEDSREYTLSTLVNTLASMQAFADAAVLAREIQDGGYREDAFAYIVKSLLIHQKIDEAIAFVESIKNMHQRSKAAKILLSSMKAHHDPERAVQIREKFELAR
jgi:hypothetical protein